MRQSSNPIWEHMPHWTQVLALAIFLIAYRTGSHFVPNHGFGILCGAIAVIAASLLFGVSCIIKTKNDKRRMKKRFESRIEALKRDGIAINHKNIYDKSIRPDVPIDDI